MKIKIVQGRGKPKWIGCIVYFENWTCFDSEKRENVKVLVLRLFLTILMWFFHRYVRLSVTDMADTLVFVHLSGKARNRLIIGAIQRRWLMTHHYLCCQPGGSALARRRKLFQWKFYCCCYRVWKFFQSHLLSGKINKNFRVLTTLPSERRTFIHFEIVEFLENFPTSTFVSKLLLLYMLTVFRTAFILI